MRLYKYTVVGKSSFPLDMLRYDCCWPRTQDDITNLSVSAVDRKDTRIQLTGIQFPTHARWNSFGWMVSKVETVSMAQSA